VSQSDTFKNISVLLKASIGCKWLAIN